MGKGKKKKKVKKVYYDEEYGFVFVLENGKRFAYKYWDNASGAIEDITIEEIK